MSKGKLAEPEYFESFDGTRIAYYDIGEGEPIVLANGLGGTFESWRFVTDKLASRYRFISWDYRGLYYSSPPPDGSTESFSMECQAKDLKRLMEHLGIGRAALFGWSMGTQVILEYYRRYPEDVCGLGLICGTAGRPFETVLGISQLKYILPAFFLIMRRLHGPVEFLAKVTASIPGFVYVWRWLGFVSASGDVEAFQELYKEIGRIDFESYFSTMLMLGRHDAWDVLPNIKVPAIIFAGERDFFTPVDVAKRMHELIPKSEFVVIPDSSHYAPLEYPEEFIGHIERFLKRCFKKGRGRKR